MKRKSELRQEVSKDFKIFWDAYGLKRERIGAERAWKRLSGKDRRAAIAGIEAYREDCRSRGVAMKYAQGYLNNRRWEDEIESSEDNEGEILAAQEKDLFPSPSSDSFEEMETW